MIKVNLLLNFMHYIPLRIQVLTFNILHFKKKIKLIHSLIQLNSIAYFSKPHIKIPISRT